MTSLASSPSNSNQPSPRKFFAPITPPGESSPAILSTAQTVLRAQAQALAYISQLYDKDESTRDDFFTCLQYMHNAILSHGKIVITGMGKSFKIAEKLVATMNSLGIHASSLHPSDALHGDLGVIRPTDVLIMITASGNTPELTTLLPHVPTGIPMLILTNTPDSPLAKQAAGTLSAAIPTSLGEKAIYGLPAPTTSTTACLAVGDAVCITLAEMLTSDVKERSRNFSKCHPGGAIGNDYKMANAINNNVAGNDDSSSDPLEAQLTNERRISAIQSKVAPWPRVGHISHCDFTTELSLLRNCVGKDWVFVDSRYLIPTTCIFQSLETLRNAKMEFDINQLTSALESYDVFTTAKHPDNDLLSLNVDATKIALLLDSQGTYSGIYYNSEL